MIYDNTMKHTINLLKVKKVYCIGIKGSGVAAVAQILKARGFFVSGSDTGEKFFTDAILKQEHIPYFETFSAEHIDESIDLVIHSTAYTDDNNSEMKKVSELGLPVMSYPEALGVLFNERLGIAVCGSHGKTTTSALFATILHEAGLAPSAVIGSQVMDWNSSILFGEGEHFVAEADEYQNKLRYYDPWSAILTSVDWDHPDFFPNILSYKKVFKEFVARIPQSGFLVVWGDSVDTIEVAKSAHCQVVTYGFGEDTDYRAIGWQTHCGDTGQYQSFEVISGEKHLGVFRTGLSGKHNVLNCLAAIALGDKMQLDTETLRQAIGYFRGTKRRFEQVGEYNESILIDDYAHHPDEIRATLSGARERFPDKQINVVFHPHTFTRTKALLAEFSQSFDDADKVVVIDIYGSAREKHGGVSSQDLVKLINKYSYGKAEHVPTINEATEYFSKILRKGSVLITMGAGDVWKIADNLKSLAK